MRTRGVVELGAGDGTLALRLARSLGNAWIGTHLTLLDLEPSVAQKTADAIRACGWTLEVVAADALDWLAARRRERVGVVFANLFVHHFEAERLTRLLGGIAAPRGRIRLLRAASLASRARRQPAARADRLQRRHAPRRGCRACTPGFATTRSAPRGAPRVAEGWTLSENAAGAFSHLFVARRDE